MGVVGLLFVPLDDRGRDEMADIVIGFLAITAVELVVVVVAVVVIVVWQSLSLLRKVLLKRKKRSRLMAECRKS